MRLYLGICMLSLSFAYQCASVLSIRSVLAVRLLASASFVANSVASTMRVCLSVLVAMMASMHALAQSEQTAADMLSQLLQRDAFFTANFEQTLARADGEAINQSSGQLQIAQPGRLRWDTLSPFVQSLMVSDEKLYQHDIDLQQLIVEPLASHLGSAPARLLAGEYALLNDQFDVSFVKSLPLSACDEAQRCFSLSPKAESNELLGQLYMRFDNNKLIEIVIRDNLDQFSTFRFFDIDTRTPIAVSRFTPDVSDDTDVIVRH